MGAGCLAWQPLTARGPSPADRRNRTASAPSPSMAPGPAASSPEGWRQRPRLGPQVTLRGAHLLSLPLQQLSLGPVSKSQARPMAQTL